MLIIAFDFDGILCNNEFPDIGRPNYNMVSLARELMDGGHEVVLWTSRVGRELERAIEWCEDRGLRFCAHNENVPSNIAQYKAKYPNGTRKVYADIYIDDHNPEFQLILHEHGYDAALRRTIEYVRRIVEWKEEN